MSGTPLIAGNWKMHGTIEEAEERVAATLPRIATLESVEHGVCQPFTALQAVVASTRGSALKVHRAEHAPRAQGAFTGEISAPMLTGSTSTVCCSATPSGARDSVRPQGAAAQGPRGAGRGPGGHPLRRRDRGGARERRYGAPAAPPGPGGLGEGADRAPRRHRDRPGRSGRSGPARSPRPSRPRTRWPSSARSSPTAKEEAERPRIPLQAAR